MLIYSVTSNNNNHSQFFLNFFFKSYPNVITEWGYAFTFSLNSDITITDKQSGFKINLHDKLYQLDTTPIISSCNCYTCRNHTKAYIHHLLNVHELLATVLLTMYFILFYLYFY